MTKAGEPQKWLEMAASYSGGGCLEWPFHIHPHNDYGMHQGKVVSRIVCAMAHGENPPDKPMALHSCNNKPCCNPNHLRWGTAKENTADWIKAGNINW